MAICLFLSIDLETVISGRPENVNTASFQHGSDFLFNRFAILKIARTFTFSGRSGCARVGAFTRTRRQGCQGKCFIISHAVGFFLKPKRDIR